MVFSKREDVYCERNYESLLRAIEESGLWRRKYMTEPMLHLPKNEDYFKQVSKQLPDLVVTSLKNGRGPDLDFFDIDIGEEILNGIGITTGPLCSDGDLVIVESLVGEYTSNGTVVKSRFTGTVRRSKRK